MAHDSMQINLHYEPYNVKRTTTMTGRFQRKKRNNEINNTGGTHTLHEIIVLRQHSGWHTHLCAHILHVAMFGLRARSFRTGTGNIIKLQRQSDIKLCASEWLQFNVSHTHTNTYALAASSPWTNAKVLKRFRIIVYYYCVFYEIPFEMNYEFLLCDAVALCRCTERVAHIFSTTFPTLSIFQYKILINSLAHRRCPVRCTAAGYFRIRRIMIIADIHCM